MTDPGNTELARLLRDRLTRAMASHGFTTPEPADPRSGRWFVPPNCNVPHAEVGVTASINEHRHGGLRVLGWLSIRSAEVGEILATTPAAWIRMDKEDRLRNGVIERHSFGEFSKPINFDLDQRVAFVEQVDPTVDWFVDFSTRPHATEWFMRHSSLDKLVSLARTPTVGTEENIDPGLMRSVPVLCILNDRAADAASLVEWYLRRGIYNPLDSHERATAFDLALRDKFPDYAAARAS